MPASETAGAGAATSDVGATGKGSAAGEDPEVEGLSDEDSDVELCFEVEVVVVGELEAFLPDCAELEPVLPDGEGAGAGAGDSVFATWPGASAFPLPFEVDTGEDEFPLAFPFPFPFPWLPRPAESGLAANAAPTHTIAVAARRDTAARSRRSTG